MKISLEQVGKKFQKHWIFRNIDYTFSAEQRYAILGNNGSGKSTLLRILAGMQTPSSGKILHELDSQNLEHSKIFHHVALCAPSLELIDEMTLQEFFEFHFSHKNPLKSLTVQKVIDLIGLQSFSERQIGDFSSGMKQRVKLAQAIFSDTPLLLLDEPCTNLDEAGIMQYRNWIENYTPNRLVIVASNDVREHYFCEERLVISDWK